MSADENKALVRRFFEAQGKEDLDAVKELLAPDFVDHSLRPGQEPGREGYIRGVVEDHAVLSDLRYVIEEQMAAEGNKVISRLAISGVHDRGEFMGLAPTGRKWMSTGVIIHRIVGGKIAEEWSESRGVLEATRQRLEQEELERERVEQELRVARNIQQASLPKEVPELEGWQITPYYQPAREVGGDFYDFLELKDGHLGLVVGDATGKGVPAALVMATTCGMLRAVALSLDSPGEVLERINEALSARIPPNMFVTCFYAILDPESGHLRYANAGHTLPCCRRHTEGRTDELVARGMPLGLMPAMSYEEKETTLLPGDGVLFCTDGLVEAHSPQGEMFGSARLRSLVSEHPTNGSDLTAFLVQKLERFTGDGREQEDDVTLVELRRSTTGS